MYPFSCALSEDASEVDQKRGITIAIVEVSKQPQLFFGREIVLLFGAGFHHFF